MPITETLVAHAARQAGLGDHVDVHILKCENDVALIHGDGEYFYLKCYAWPGTRADILRRVLGARNWSSLWVNPHTT